MRREKSGRARKRQCQPISRCWCPSCLAHKLISPISHQKGSADVVKLFKWQVRKELWSDEVAFTIGTGRHWDTSRLQYLPSIYLYMFSPVAFSNTARMILICEWIEGRTWHLIRRSYSPSEQYAKSGSTAQGLIRKSPVPDYEECNYTALSLVSSHVAGSLPCSKAFKRFLIECQYTPLHPVSRC